MTEQLRALAAPAEDKSLVPALTMGNSQSPTALVPRDAMPSPGLHKHLYEYSVFTYFEATYIYVK